MKKYFKCTGFTLIEMLVVLMVISVIGGIASFSIYKNVSDVRENMCNTNRQILINQINGAKEMDDIEEFEEIIAGIDARDICPSNGEITVQGGFYDNSFEVVCSIHKDGE